MNMWYLSTNRIDFIFKGHKVDSPRTYLIRITRVVCSYLEVTTSRGNWHYLFLKKYLFERYFSEISLGESHIVLISPKSPELTGH